MLQTSENETEILLGNKQLLGIFFVVVVLLGVAFTGGYMVGRGAGDKKTAATASAEPSSGSVGQATGGETKVVTPESPAESQPSTPATTDDTADTPPPPVSKPAKKAAVPPDTDEPPLGAPKRKEQAKKVEPPAPPAEAPAGGYTPQGGQTFLQVAAVGRDEAEAVADVLHKKGFRAHAVPKPGSTKIYRVIIGPIKDTSDLSSTRESLRKTGFREVIVQHY